MECHASSGNNQRNSRKAFDIGCHALVATPLLDFSERTLLFQLSYIKGMGCVSVTVVCCVWVCMCV